MRVFRSMPLPRSPRGSWPAPARRPYGSKMLRSCSSKPGADRDPVRCHRPRRPVDGPVFLEALARLAIGASVPLRIASGRPRRARRGARGRRAAEEVRQSHGSDSRCMHDRRAARREPGTMRCSSSSVRASSPSCPLPPTPMDRLRGTSAMYYTYGLRAYLLAFGISWASFRSISLLYGGGFAARGRDLRSRGMPPPARANTVRRALRTRRRFLLRGSPRFSSWFSFHPDVASRRRSGSTRVVNERARFADRGSSGGREAHRNQMPNR